MHQTGRWMALVAAAALLPAGQVGKPPEVRVVAVGDGVELHYVERGKGVAVLFIHGSLGDYSTWDSQLGPFAETYRAIACSRRYNYPNTNKLRPKHSAVVEAEDLAAFIKKLDLGKVHVIGHSYGGYAALFLAVKRLIIGLGDGIGVTQLPRERDERLLVRSGERGRIGAENEDVGELQSLDAVCGHEADGVFVLARLQRNHAACFAEQSEVVDQSFQFRGLVDLLRFPGLHEL